MIVQVTGKVTYPITLDPTVWIFDDRKVSFDKVFDAKDNSTDMETKESSLNWSQQVYQQKINPPVNKSISKLEGKKSLEGTYVMPLKDFLFNAEPEKDAAFARLETDKEDVTISFDHLVNSFLLFAEEGRIVQDRGPIHLYFDDGSNKDSPIKGIKKIILE